MAPGYMTVQFEVWACLVLSIQRRTKTCCYNDLMWIFSCLETNLQDNQEKLCKAAISALLTYRVVRLNWNFLLISILGWTWKNWSEYYSSLLYSKLFVHDSGMNHSKWPLSVSITAAIMGIERLQGLTKCCLSILLHAAIIAVCKESLFLFARFLESFSIKPQQ